MILYRGYTANVGAARSDDANLLKKEQNIADGLKRDEDPHFGVTTASSGGSECDTASSSACGTECDGVSASAAARESAAADHSFRLVLDASPDGLPVLVGQRLPRCEQQRVLPSGWMEPRLFRREQPERAHVCGLLGASNN